MGGVLEVHVYAGRDGTFTLVEDDGASLDYVTSPAGATRSTAFAWDDAHKVLSWTVAGGYGGDARTYTSCAAVLFVVNASGPVYAAPAPLGVAGSVQF